MAEPPPDPPPPPPDKRAERLKAALRANLHKRKSRERAESGKEP
jgi:hypothetical protein